MDEIVKEITELANETKQIVDNPDAWWRERGNKLRAQACEYCQGSGIAYFPNGPDDYFTDKCVCQEQD